jgi:transposase
MKLLALTIGS